MRILILTPNFAPELTGVGKTTAELAAWLAEQHHEVRVITTPPYYPEWQIHAGYQGWRYRREPCAQDRIRVWRCPMWVPRRPSGAKRLLHLASFALSSLPVLFLQVSWRPELVMTMEPTLFCAPGALLAAKIAGAKSWLHIQDFEVDAAFGLRMLKTRSLLRTARAWEAWCMRRFDRVSTISRPMLQRAIQNGAPPERTVLFPNWVDLDALQEDASASRALRTQWSIGANRILALYSGNLGSKQGIEVILAAARRLQDRSHIQFVICGAGAMRAEIASAAATLPNLQLRELVPASQLSALLHAADVHLMPQRAGAADLVMPSKLMYMLASGRPVVATADPETEIGRAVGLAGGILVAPGDTEGFARAVDDIAKDHTHWEAAGRRGRQVAEAEFGRGGVLANFARHLQDLDSTA